MMTVKTTIATEESRQSNSNAKSAALEAVEQVSVQPTSMVSYQSRGVVLIVCDALQAGQSLASELSNEFQYHYLVTSERQNSGSLTALYGSVERIDGYLGAFEVDALIANKPVTLDSGNKDKKFDLVLDLVGAQFFKPDVIPPFGYYDLSQQSLDEGLLSEINALYGALDKPKFFHLDTNLCVHSRNKVEACNRCIEVCPAKAISTDGDSVQVDPFLCHGFGSCASVCPAGAISYAYPSAEDSFKLLHALVNEYRLAGGTQPALLFYGRERKDQNFDVNITKVAGNILPFEVEEVGSLGLDILLYSFCLGVSEVFIYAYDEHEKTRRELNRQIGLADRILKNLGYDNNMVLVDMPNVRTEGKPSGLNDVIDVLYFSNKRNRIFAAVDFLYEQVQAKSPPAQLDFTKEEDAPFGRVIIDEEKCTLCMACTSVCPVNALTPASSEQPVLNFKEDACVQCGICASSCPEDALSLDARFLFDKAQRSQSLTLHQDKAFECTLCGKPFGSRQLIKKMLVQLKGHAMFNDGKLAHLEKCEDCRVKALFDED